MHNTFVQLEYSQDQELNRNLLLTLEKIFQNEFRGSVNKRL